MGFFSFALVFAAGMLLFLFTLLGFVWRYQPQFPMPVKVMCMHVCVCVYVCGTYMYTTLYNGQLWNSIGRVLHEGFVTLPGTLVCVHIYILKMYWEIKCPVCLILRVFL